MTGSDSLGFAKTVGHIRLASLLPISKRPNLELLASCAEGGEIQRPGNRFKAVVDCKQNHRVFLSSQRGAEVRYSLGGQGTIDSQGPVAGQGRLEFLGVVGGRLVETVIVGLDAA